MQRILLLHGMVVPSRALRHPLSANPMHRHHCHSRRESKAALDLRILMI